VSRVITHERPPLLSVEEVATKLGVSGRTVRRWCACGHLEAQLVGTVWVVWGVLEDSSSEYGRGSKYSERPLRLDLQAMRKRLRESGQRLIDTGNVVAGAQRRPGKLFLTWQSQRGLQVTFAIGRLSPLHGWAPHALGTMLPFWIEERQQWRRVVPLLKHYERIRAWCAPRLLCVAGVGALVLEEIARLEIAIAALQEDDAEVTHSRMKQDTPSS
jgi:excisionase family DNA binding protein